jgi:AcrR family transcriptional regulator
MLPPRPADSGREAPPRRTKEQAKRERNAAATRERLLDAAEREFAMLGFAGARLREIADGAGVQPALIHHYFVDKQGLYRAVLDRALAQTSEDSWTLLGTHRDLEGFTRGFIDLLVGFHAAHENLLAILRHEAVSGGTIFGDVLRERIVPVIDAVRAFIVDRQRVGEIRDDIPADEMILATMSMVVHPFSEARMLEAILPGAAPRNRDALERRKRVIVAVLLDGFRCGAPAD